MGYTSAKGGVDEVAVAKAMRRHKEKALKGAENQVPVDVGMGRMETKDMQLRPLGAGNGHNNNKK